MNLINELNAYQYVLKILKEKEGFIWWNVIGINNDEHGNPRYHIIRSENENIFIKFSREPYKSGKSGGFKESINLEGGIRECFKRNVKRLFWIYPNGSIYWIEILNFMELAETRITNNENKKVYTINLSQLKRYK